ncbi:MAG: hypothetical protein C0501_22330 [Isosphaera sp.]|nr:hypothetical protein [Isosphaera sp.]
MRVRAEVLALLQADRDGGGPGLTRKQLLDGLPDELRKGENRFRGLLEDGCGTLWAKGEREGRGGGSVYRFGCYGAGEG